MKPNETAKYQDIAITGVVNDGKIMPNITSPAVDLVSPTVSAVQEKPAITKIEESSPTPTIKPTTPPITIMMAILEAIW